MREGPAGAQDVLGDVVINDAAASSKRTHFPFGDPDGRTFGEPQASSLANLILFARINSGCFTFGLVSRNSWARLHDVQPLRWKYQLISLLMVSPCLSCHEGSKRLQGKKRQNEGGDGEPEECALMNTFDAIMSRRTAHVWKDQPVPEEVVMKALEGAHMALPPVHLAVGIFKGWRTRPKELDLALVLKGGKGADSALWRKFGERFSTPHICWWFFRGVKTTLLRPRKIMRPSRVRSRTSR